MGFKLMPPQNKVQAIAYATVLPSYYPDIISDYEKVNSECARKIWELLCTEINHLESSYQRWLTFNTTDEGWTSHLKRCGYVIPNF